MRKSNIQHPTSNVQRPTPNAKDRTPKTERRRLRRAGLRIQHRTSGFTLVELLVSVTLTLVIMTMFAQAFQIATGLMLTQKGTAENDQRARSIVGMLRGDLQKASYRQRRDANTKTIFLSGDTIANALKATPEPAAVEEFFETNLANTANRQGWGIVPLHPGYTVAGVGGKGREADGEQEKGYFYISENDLFDDGDDVLQFTIDAKITERGNGDESRFLGRASVLGPGVPDPPRPTIYTWNHLADSAVNTKQPIWDDGLGFKEDKQDADGDGLTNDAISYSAEDTATSSSPQAEVSIFLRGGNLMRRIVLVREGSQPERDAPLPAEDYILGNYRPGIEDVSPTALAIPTSDFWNDFDFSATRIDPELDVAEGVRMQFNTEDALDNRVVRPLGLKPQALGNPQMRFGHDASPRRLPIAIPGFGISLLQGRPKEHLNPLAPNLFIGRFTHQETSDPDFGFPGLPLGVLPPSFVQPDPLHIITPLSPDSALIGGLSDNFPAGGNGVVDLFEDGPRQGEDILMPNVHSFDVKVWDAVINDWVDIGHTRTAVINGVVTRGDWHISRVFGVIGGPDLPGTQWTPFAPGDIFDPGDAASRVWPYQSARRRMYRYGSLDGSLAVTNVAFNRVFDTWHPQFNFDAENDDPARPVNDPLDDPPPFRPQWTDRESFPFQSGMAGDARAWPVVWEAGHEYQFPFNRDTSAPAPTQPCRVFPRPRELGGAGSGLYVPGHQSMFYQVVDVQDAPPFDGTFLSGATEPVWPAVAGEEVQDGEIRWRAFNNTIGLQAIQLTIRFLDPTSQQMRQVTIIHPFVEL